MHDEIEETRRARLQLLIVIGIIVLITIAFGVVRCGAIAYTTASDKARQMATSVVAEVATLQTEVQSKVTEVVEDAQVAATQAAEKAATLQAEMQKQPANTAEREPFSPVPEQNEATDEPVEVTEAPQIAPVPDSEDDKTDTVTSERVFNINYRGCTGGTSKDIGVVKGQVFDQNNNIIRGARVTITIDGILWDSPANPAPTNVDGWYEWYLAVGQRVNFVSLDLPGSPARLSEEAQRFEVHSQGGCFQHVDFIER